MKLHIENCNNIDNGDVEVKENMLNIKYAINGTGKSTICSAITIAVRDKSKKENAISSLKPYKRLDDETVQPSITGIERINNVRIFNEEYIDEYIFQQDELVKGSFDIFIRNEEYDRGILEIESLVQEIKTILSTDKEIESLKNDFGELINAFGRETKKGLHGSSMMSKAFKEGNKVENIPPGLEMYRDYIHSKENYRWIKWQLDGQAFIDITENCPYCITDIKEKKDTIRKVSQSYDPKIIENMTKILLVFQRLGEYFSEKTKETINTFVKSVSGYTEEQAEFLREVRDQIERLKRKFENAQTIGFNSLRDVDKVIDGLKEYIIDLTLYNHLDSAKTAEKVSIVNSSIEKVTEKAGILQGCIKKQQRLIETIVKTNNEEINAFLYNAGYKYHVDLIEDDSGIRRLKLIYTDTNGIVLDAKGHLSF
ncbi:MAG: hypothetical protein AMQ74_01258 [Candidatus Methanofastidiosum methylothiophilum]|uniref:Protein CR006 P-loop domain-containing protein n=1 Tax=Candidatus Methanofastidiosum methylothiophilum TaxID=1705564 RepID=A0A150IZK8_9EURY|nr:MAG: hypothetical protein AMQ74_01258 [Candidatus Methanofastidiosum methylthiophilus]